MHLLKIIALTCATGALAGCAFQRYRAAPISPAQTAASLEARTLADPGLRQYVLAHTQHPPASWPLPQWNPAELTLAAFYFNPAMQVARARVSQAEAAILTAEARPMLLCCS